MSEENNQEGGQPETVAVPKAELERLRQTNQELKSQKDDYERQLELVMSEVQKHRVPQEPQRRNLDPDILRTLQEDYMPAILEPYLAKIEEQDKAIQRLSRSSAQSEAERYLQKHIPNLEKEAPVLRKFIEALPEDIQQDIISDPKRIVAIYKTMQVNRNDRELQRAMNQTLPSEPSNTHQTKAPDYDENDPEAVRAHLRKSLGWRNI